LKEANLTPEERHNLQVDRNVEEWEKSLLTKSYSIFVLFIIMFGQIGNQMEQGILNPAF
jgi:MFS family permease